MRGGTSIICALHNTSCGIASIFSDRDYTCFCSCTIQQRTCLSGTSFEQQHAFGSNMRLGRNSTTSVMRLGCTSSTMSVLPNFNCSTVRLQRSFGVVPASATSAMSAAAAHYARTAASSQMRRDMPCSNSSTTAHSQVCLQLSSDTRLAPTEHLPAINTALALQLQERCNVSDALLATAAVSASATVERQRLRCVHICISSCFSSFSIGDCAACASAAAVAVGP